MNFTTKTAPSQISSDRNPPILEIWGDRTLKGNVEISGAKNSALAIMAGSLLCPGDCRLRNIPDLVDINRMNQILIALGVKVVKNGNILDIDASNVNPTEAPYDIVSQLRASFFAVGSLLTRFGTVKIPLPGGCKIGSRPVKLHLQGLQAMGANVFIESGVVNAHVPGTSGRLKGAKIYLDYPSVGATETLLMAATLADGETTIENAAQEPEVVDLANFCNQMGAKVIGAGTNKITIIGVDRLHSVDYKVIPDRIEAGTFLIAGAITNSEITLSSVVPQHLVPVIAKLEAMGCQIISEEPNRLRLIPGSLKATEIETLPYPGFPTDMQAPFMALLSVTPGNSIISETVFENRMGHVAELQRMGANIILKGSHALISGVPFLSGAPVMATDLRASAALVVAGLAAKGKTIVQGLHHLDRGYENIEEKLVNLGANIKRITY